MTMRDDGIRYYGPYHGKPESGRASLDGMTITLESVGQEAPEFIVCGDRTYKYQGIQYGTAFYSLSHITIDTVGTPI